MSKGRGKQKRRIDEFNAAPAAVQTAFWAELGREVAKARERDQRVFELHGVWPRRWRSKTRWDQRWRDRVYKHVLAEERGTRHEPDFERQKDRLLAIPAEEYAERILGGEFERRGTMISCPAHEERTPSCNLRDTRWHCFGCGEGGSIYDFAGRVWDLVCYGKSFREIHDRLLEIFP